MRRPNVGSLVDLNFFQERDCERPFRLDTVVDEAFLYGSFDPEVLVKTGEAFDLLAAPA
jgi:hypothetical protein